MISVGSASVGAAATGAGASSGATRPFWYIWGGAAGAAGAASPGASSANDGSTTAHKLPASIARREVGLPHGRSVRPDAAESSAQSTRLDLMGRAVPAQRGGRCGPLREVWMWDRVRLLYLLTLLIRYLHRLRVLKFATPLSRPAPGVCGHEQRLPHVLQLVARVHRHVRAHQALPEGERVRQ